MVSGIQQVARKLPQEANDNAVDVGHPMKVGGRYNVADQVYDDGDRADLQQDQGGRLKTSVFKLRPGSTQTLAIGSTSAALASGVASRAARVSSDVACHFAVASAAVATTSDAPLAADRPEEIGLRAGEKIAVIVKAGGATGTLYVTTLDSP